MPDDDPRDVGVGDDDDGDGDDDKPSRNQKAPGGNQGGNRGGGRNQGGRRQGSRRRRFRIQDAAIFLLPGLGNLGFLESWMSRGMADGVGEQAVRILARDGVKKGSMHFTDEVLLKQPQIREMLLSVDPRWLSYPIRLAVGVLLERFAPENDILWDMTDEFVQEIQQRLEGIRSGEIPMEGVTANPATEAKKTEAKRIQAVAFLNEFPLIEQRITRLFTVPAERLAVKTRVRDALDTKDEAKYLARPVPPAVLPFIGLVFNADGTRTALGQKWLVLRTKLFKYDLAQYEPVEEQLRQRIESAPQLEALVAGNPPLEVFTQRLNRLPETDGMEKTQFEEDLLFIEDSKGTSRVRDFFKGIVRQVKKIDHIVPNEINDGASALADEIDNLANSLFGAL